MSSLGNAATSSAASSAALLEWLREALEARTGTPDATFADLYQVSEGIELTIVAVDIHNRQHRVFNHIWSPTVSVASAALASSSIPFALPPRRLLVAGDSRFAAPIVDGGVWTNFPTFVFADAEFRAYHDMPPMATLGLHQIGFLLDETPHDDDVEMHRPARFVEVPRSLRAAIKEAEDDDLERVPIPSEILLSFGAEQVTDALGITQQRRRRPFKRDGEMILSSWLRDSTAVAGFRSTRKSEATDGGATTVERSLFRVVDMLEVIVIPIYVAVLVLASLVATSLPAVALVRSVDHGVWWTHLLWWFTLLAAVGLGVAAAIILLSVVIGHAVVYWPARRFGALIVGTYVAGSGAPYWTGYAPRSSNITIVRLPIPPGLRTTTFALDDTELEATVQAAYTTTRLALAELESRRAPSAGIRLSMGEGAAEEVEPERCASGDRTGDQHPPEDT